MKKMMIILAMLFTTGAFAHCPMEFSDANLCADIEWTYGPFAMDQNNSFKISFWQKGDATHAPAEVEMTNETVFPWMYMANGHQHGSRPVEVTKLGTGFYQVDKVFMMKMMGYWVVKSCIQDECAEKKVELQ